MINHDIIAAALQKYYSALKSLDEFGKCGNFFDDVSNLDKFFSEFRNITFVIQKAVKTEENNKKYVALREKYLCGDTLKWFVDVRNRTTKERPFELRKELVIDLYLPWGIYRLKDKSFIVDVDVSFKDALDYIRSFFIEQLGLKEVFFSVKIVFYESNEIVDFYPKIKNGIIQMNEFIEAIEEQFTCDCEMCCTLKEQVENLLKKVLVKELYFTTDYTLELGKEAVEGEKVEMYFGVKNSKYTAISSMRTSLDKSMFKDVRGCLRQIFMKFVSMHIAIFQMQQHDIMPVFMIVYNDDTFRMLPFMATTKATFYRKVLEITDMADFQEASAVFYCGEYYFYDINQFSEINEKPYSERIHSAQKEILSFVMIGRENSEMSIELEEERIDEMEYVLEQLQKVESDNKHNIDGFDWLMPIRIKLNT